MIQREKGDTNGHRGCFDIIATILTAASSGAKKTQIMYKCNLSFRQLEMYLNLLVEKRLLNGKLHRQSRESIMYNTTEKGRFFLQVYHALTSLLTH